MSEKRLICVFDSGLGGLTVYRELAGLLPDVATVYLADDAAFPYGKLTEQVVIERVVSVIAAALDRIAPDVVVIACNTASTSVLPHLRSRWPDVDFVGTVPAVKPAAEQSRSGLITVLGTAGTVSRDYTHALIRDHAAHRTVTLVGSDRLAALAEAHVHGRPVADEVLVAELEPCFIELDGKRTDQIVLACTHYPLLLDRFEELTRGKVGWPVNFIDPASAIARRAGHVLSGRSPRADTVALTPRHQVWTTSGSVDEPAARLFASFGLVFRADFSCPFTPKARAPVPAILQK